MPTDCYFQLESSREYTRVVTGESIVDAGDDCKEVGIGKIQSTNVYSVECCGLYQRMLQIIGYDDINLHADAKILFMTKSVRMFSFGFLIIFLVDYLKCIGFHIDAIGLFFTLTLIGDAIVSLLITSYADRCGRKRCLIIGSILSLITGTVFMVSRKFYILLVAAILGVISPSGSEVGPFMAIEISSLSEVSDQIDGTRLMALYNLIGSISSAFGALLCGYIIYLYKDNIDASNNINAYRISLGCYVVLQFALLVFFTTLSTAIEAPVGKVSSNSVHKNPFKLFLGLHQSKQIVLKLSVLFMIDSFAGSFLLQSLIASWFHDKYNTSIDIIGKIIFVCNIIAGFSALVAATIAKKIGLILTMVFTHLPSNFLTILVPIMPTENLAIMILIARYSISQMDVPTRNAYVQDVVNANERSAASGVTNMAKTIGASLGPYVAGFLYGSTQFASYPWFIAGVLKIIYDLLLLYSFQSVKPSTEK